MCRTEQHQRQLAIKKLDGTICPLHLEAGKAAVLNIGGSLVLTQEQFAALSLDEYQHMARVSIHSIALLASELQLNGKALSRAVDHDALTSTKQHH